MTAIAAQDATGARNFSELILGALAREGGLTKDEICNRIDAFGVRVERALQHQLNMGIIERDMDYALAPPTWRHWMRGQKPPGWRSKRPEAPRAAPAPAPAPAAIVEISTPAPSEPAEPAVKAESEPATSTRALVLDFVNEHPGGVQAKDLFALTKDSRSGEHLAKLWRDGKIARKGQRGTYSYFPMGPKEPRIEVEQMKKNTGSTQRTQRATNTTIEERVLQLVRDSPGISGQKIGMTLGQKQTNGVAIRLVNEGKIESRDRRYYPPAHPTTPGDAPKPAPRKPATKQAKRAPRAIEVRASLDLDALEAAIQRVRAAREELETAENDLRALTQGA